MKNKRINLNKIEKLAGLTFRNAIRLHNDAILLFKEKSYASAYFLSILALEEYGKMCILTNILFHSRAKETTEKEEIEEHLKLIYSHRNKQSEFIYVNMLNLPKNFIKNVCNGKIEKLKQNSVYVGLWNDTVVRNTNITSPRTGSPFYNKGGNGFNAKLV